MKTSLFQTSDRLRPRAHATIPGGAHTYAKGDDQYPVLSPGFIDRGLGSHVWDVDGNEYVDYVGSWGPMILGHAHPDVVAALQEAANAHRALQDRTAVGRTQLLIH